TNIEAAGSQDSMDLVQLGGRIVWMQVFHNLIAEREIDAAVLRVDRNARRKSEAEILRRVRRWLQGISHVDRQNTLALSRKVAGQRAVAGSYLEKPDVLPKVRKKVARMTFGARPFPDRVVHRMVRQFGEQTAIHLASNPGPLFGRRLP